MTGINKCLSVKICLLLTWLQSSWKVFEAYIWDEIEQETCFRWDWKLCLDLSYVILHGNWLFRWDWVPFCKLWLSFSKKCFPKVINIWQLHSASWSCETKWHRTNFYIILASEVHTWRQAESHFYQSSPFDVCDCMCTNQHTCHWFGVCGK